MNNEYIPFLSEIREVIKHTDTEYTFRMAYQGEVKPGQFFEISLPKVGECPISISGIGEGTIDFTIRRVGKVTNEVFEHYVGDKLFLRGPYGNGFDLENYKGKEMVVIAGGTGLSPVKGVVDYFNDHMDEIEGMTLIVGFKSPKDVLFLEDLKKWQKNINIILTVDESEQETSYNIGMVTEYIPDLQFKNVKETVAIVVGPPAMMKFTTLGLLDIGIKEENIWISQERKMCCGIGKCGHCKVDDVYICLDGPVFNYTKGRQLLD